VPVINPVDPSQMAVQIGTVTTTSDPTSQASMNVTQTVPQTLNGVFPGGGTKVQKAIVSTNTAGVVTWTFPTPFQNPPAIAAICEGDGSSVIPAQVTAVSATQVTVKISKATAAVNGLLGLTIMVAVGSPGVTNVHLYAAPNPN
jgi:hypothetical protein